MTVRGFALLPALPVALAVASSAALPNLAAAQRAVTAPAPERTAVQTRTVAVDGRRVRVQTGGWRFLALGRPVVVFQAGAATGLDGWGSLVVRVAAFAPVVAYDRPGLGESAWDGRPPTPARVDSTLRRVLAAVGARPPYVFVGHSWGGALAQYSAAARPAEAAGLVRVDARDLTRLVAHDREVYDALGTGDAGRLRFYDELRRGAAESPPGVRAEAEVIAGLQQPGAPDFSRLTVPAVPTAVLVAGRFPEPPPGAPPLPVEERRWWDVDERVTLREAAAAVGANPEATLIYATHAAHFVHADDPGLVADAVRRVAFPNPARQLRLALAAGGRGGAAAALARYDTLARRYPAGALDEALLNTLGYELLSAGRPADAARLFERNARAYPDSPNVYDSLGDAYVAAGRPADARASYRRAVARAEASGDPRLPAYRANLAQAAATQAPGAPRPPR